MNTNAIIPALQDATNALNEVLSILQREQNTTLDAEETAAYIRHTVNETFKDFIDHTLASYIDSRMAELAHDFIDKRVNVILSELDLGVELTSQIENAVDSKVGELSTDDLKDWDSARESIIDETMDKMADALRNASISF